jgi:hypothetical protein
VVGVADGTLIGLDAHVLVLSTKLVGQVGCLDGLGQTRAVDPVIISDGQSLVQLAATLE